MEKRIRNKNYFVSTDYRTEIFFESCTTTEIKYPKIITEQKTLNSNLIINRKHQTKTPLQQKMHSWNFSTHCAANRKHQKKTPLQQKMHPWNFCAHCAKTGLTKRKHRSNRKCIPEIFVVIARLKLLSQNKPLFFQRKSAPTETTINQYFPNRKHHAAKNSQQQLILEKWTSTAKF